MDKTSWWCLPIKPTDILLQEMHHLVNPYGLFSSGMWGKEEKRSSGCLCGSIITRHKSTSGHWNTSVGFFPLHSSETCSSVVAGKGNCIFIILVMDKVKWYYLLTFSFWESVDWGKSYSLFCFVSDSCIHTCYNSYQKEKMHKLVFVILYSEIWETMQNPL